ncbi:MAG: NmrA family transcriptional regulator [Pseudonocardiaceae bacterium]
MTTDNEHDFGSGRHRYHRPPGGEGPDHARGAGPTLRRTGGARRLVLLSGRGEEQAQRAEQVLMESGAIWTVVRSAFFAQNFSETYFVDSIRSGVLALPVGDVEEPFIDADDVADVVVAALTEHGHEGQLYEVTGPALLSFADAVAQIAKAAGRQLSYQQISVHQFVSALAAEGVPDDLVAVLTEVFTTVLDGRNAYVTNGAHRALGRQPRDFADFARSAATTGAWTA